MPLWSAIYLPIMGVLAVALEPLTLEQIMLFGGIKVKHEALNAIDHLRRFLIKTNDRYAFFHASFSEFLTSKVTKKDYPDYYLDMAQWHRRITVYYLSKLPPLS